MSAAPRPAVGLVDDDEDYRNHLKAQLKTANVNLLTFASAQEFLDAATPKDAKPFGCVLIDLRMPGMDGMQLIKEMQQRKISTPVILLTAHVDLSTAIDATRAGAFDVIDKKAKDEVVVERIKAVLNSYGKMRKLVDERTLAVRRIAKLTPREIQVLDLMVQGRPNRLIAEELGISPKTLDIHRSNVMDKLEAKTVADLVRFRLIEKIDNLAALPPIFG